MGFWVPKPTLADGETLLWQIAANRTQGGRAVGGRLFVTDAHLRFQANRVDRVTGGSDWCAAQADVIRAAVADRSSDGGPFSGGLRRRLHLEMAGSDEYFVVNGAEGVAQKISAWAAGV